MLFNYSLIIPHYNIPDLLERLLSTIPKRKDLQVIVVDDCSPEPAQVMLQQLKSKFNWVEFYSTGSNGGGGKARNIGLQQAKGKYLIFADADDYFESDFNNILNDYSNKEFDIAFFRGSSRDPERDVISHRTDHLNKYINNYFSGQDPNGDNLRFLFGEPWCKIINMGMVKTKQIKFDEINIHNDTKFAYLIGFYGKSIIVDDRILYCITARDNSVSKTISDDRILTRIKVFAEAEKFLKDNNIGTFSKEHYNQLIRLIVHRKYKLFHDGMNIIYSLGISKKTIYIECCETLMKIIATKLINSFSSFK